MIEKALTVLFTNTTTAAENFSINLGNEASFKLIRSLIVSVQSSDATLVWGFSSTSNGVGDVAIVGVNAPGATPNLAANTIYTIVDSTSMVGTNHAYMRFSINHTAGDIVGISLTYYDFSGLSLPSYSILNGTLNQNESITLNYGTAPKLEVIKSLWISAPLTTTIKSYIGMHGGGGPLSGIDSVDALTSSSLNVIPPSYGIWLPDNTSNIFITNDTTSTGPLNYYLTGIGR